MTSAASPKHHGLIFSEEILLADHEPLSAEDPHADLGTWVAWVARPRPFTSMSRGVCAIQHALITSAPTVGLPSYRCATALTTQDTNEESYAGPAGSSQTYHVEDEGGDEGHNERIDPYAGSIQVPWLWELNCQWKR
jgi:hypothetical protein